MRLEAVLTRTGKRIHYALAGHAQTLCHAAVHERRQGGSWRPERMDVLTWPTCQLCSGHALDGEKP